MSEFINVNKNVYAPGVDNNIDANSNRFFDVAECGCTSGLCFGIGSCMRFSKNIECDTTCGSLECKNQCSQRYNPILEHIFCGETRSKGYCLYIDQEFIPKGTILGY